MAEAVAAVELGLDGDKEDEDEDGDDEDGGVVAGFLEAVWFGNGNENERGCLYSKWMG